MPGRALPAAKKAQIATETKDALMQKAIELYRYEHRPERVFAPKEKPLSLQKVCTAITNGHFADTKNTIPLDPCTLGRLLKGGKTKSQSNAEKGWLTAEEVDIVINYAIEVAARGFPLTHQRLKEHVDEICRARLGDKFPESGVADDWTYRFLLKHSARVKTYWSHNLDTKRGRAVNPTTNAQWFELLDEVLKGKRDHEFEDLSQSDSESTASAPPPVPILEKDTYGCDESGFFPDGGVRVRVIGPKGKTTQHQQSDGGRENTTVMVTICADGTALKPAVIFKGQAYQVKWNQDNPAEASLSYSKKGWTDGEIGVEYIKDFHEQTKAKTEGRTRLLLVDGHNSHYTRGFLEFARAHRIHVLCYPAHATHVYQGLDVVIFGPLKVYWTQEKDRWLREKRQKVDKTNFLAIYGAAHIRALTPENIKAAFRKTGVWPFNPSVITPSMLAPSLETSFQGNLPVAPDTPIRAVTDLFGQARKRARTSYADTGIDRQHDSGIYDGLPSTTTTPPIPTRPVTPEMMNIVRSRDPFTTPVRKAIRTLGESSVSFLVTSSPIQSTSQLPAFERLSISPQKPKHERLLRQPPQTPLEAELQDALRDTITKNATQKKSLIRMQSTLVLNGLYCDLVRGQLAAQEESRKKKMKGRLVGDGLPRLLTSRAFVQKVVEFHEEAKRKETELSERRVTKAERAQAMKEWKLLDDERKEENKRIKAEWAEDVKRWEVERDRAKHEGRRPGWKKPQLKGLLFGAVPKPQFVVETDGPAEGILDDQDGEKDGDDEDTDDQDGEGSEDSD